MSISTQVSFHNTNLNLIQHNQKHWLTASEIASALGYKNDDAVSRIYRRNVDEFSHGMTETVNLTVSGNIQTTARIFSLRGAHLIAMFSRTKLAKDFRKWVLDILDKETEQNTPNEIMPIMPPSSMRFLMNMEKGHVVSTQIVPEDSMVFRLEEIPQLLKEPGYFSASQLKIIADTATAKLAEWADQANYLQRK
ncbi:hypothetical protein C1O25_16255 [Vibrio diazotrophicus]|uniref:Bro-N domain-containing protein n=2 Tax=Vibrio diazotrophicus TaxID=685 RepID=A0ABX4W7B9_VIBDI|nr:hypothetical protein C1O25_16255 [Vibrio diazotrophicus]